MLYCWARSLSVTQAATETGLSQQTVSVWFRLVRQAVKDHVEEDPLFNTPIGGPGSIVEIDEAMLYHSTLNKGRKVEGFVTCAADASAGCLKTVFCNQYAL